MKTVKKANIDVKKLITKSAYARELKVTPAAVDKMVKSGRVSVVEIEGAELIHKD